MDIKIYYIDTAAVLHPMVILKTDLIFGNQRFQVETIDDSLAQTANYTGLIGIIFKKITYSFQDFINIINAAHTQAFAGATNRGFKLTVESEMNQATIINTKTT